MTTMHNLMGDLYNMENTAKACWALGYVASLEATISTPIPVQLTNDLLSELDGLQDQVSELIATLQQEQRLNWAAEDEANGDTEAARLNRAAAADLGGVQ